jgi:hypothetical protein
METSLHKSRLILVLLSICWTVAPGKRIKYRLVSCNGDLWTSRAPRDSPQGSNITKLRGHGVTREMIRGRRQSAHGGISGGSDGNKSWDQLLHDIHLQKVPFVSFMTNLSAFPVPV